MSVHSSLSGIELHESKRLKEPVRTASTANITLATPGASMDGVTLTNGDRVLLKNQSTAAQNGLYIWAGASTLLVRTSDADAAADFVYGFLTFVREGTANAATYWLFATTSAITVDTTSLSFTAVLASGLFGGEVTGTDFNATGLTGAVSASRYVGATTGGPPSTGTFAIGDFVVARNATAGQPNFWICTVAGSPGTWVPDSSNPLTAVGDLIIGGTVANGYAANTRLAAGATSGHVLTSQGSGVAPAWAAPTGSGGGGGGGSGALVPIMVVGPLTAAQTTLPFTFIPQTGFRNLRLVVSGRSTAAVTVTGLQVVFNSDTGTNYDYSLSQSASNTTTVQTVTANTSGLTGVVPGSTGLASSAGMAYVYMPSYNSTTFNKTWHGEGASHTTGVVTGIEFTAVGGQWESTAAINSITLQLGSGNFDVGSYACLYGEMDTAGVLLTPASNMLYETTLTAAAASISTGTLSQSYRDLRVEVIARGDTAATSTAMSMRINGDTGANYNFEQIRANGAAAGGTSSTGQTSGNIFLNMPAATGTANVFGSTTIRYVNYTATVGFKTWSSLGFDLLTNAPQVDGYSGWWASQVPITALSFTPAAGNFVAGTTIRVYGEPAASGGASVGTGTRLRISANQSTTTGTATLINWDVEDNDADNQHYESATNLSGTVTKTAGSQTVTGSGTAFTTELSIGQVISVTGTATEKRAVIAIASATSLTVNSAFVNTQAGATATRINSAVVFRQPGFYTLETNIYSAALSTGAITLAFYLNNLTTVTSGTAIAQSDPIFVNASAGYNLVATRQFQQWDFVEVVWTQNAGTVNVLADERTHWAINARPTVIVAVPYVNIQDQKAQNTAGGTFTSGADRTRDLNTIDSDTAGIASLATNQVTIPAGTYRYKISSPGYQCGAHQAFLYNVTDTTEVKRGSTETSGSASATTTSSMVTGKVRISGSKAFEVRHRCTTTSNTNGFGLPANFGTEIYTTFEAWKEG